MSEVEMTDEVRVMLGNPKRALIAMAIPIVIANLIQSVNSIIDTVWLTSIGVEAQAAVNVIFPIFFLTIGVGNGLSVGASQALARRIGSQDHKGANDVAMQGLMLSLLVSIVITIPFLLFAEQIVIIAGGESNLEACMDYALPVFFGIPGIIIIDMFSGLLRSEGASKRAMYIMILGAGLNICLDPLFIFGFDMGISGAAIATMLSMYIPIILVLYWYCIRRSTFIRLSMKGFRFDSAQIKDILTVGVPASLEIVLIAMAMMIMNIIIEGTASVDGVAIFGNGWKIIDLFFMPTMAIGFAVVPICAAALGAKDAAKIRSVYILALKYAVGISILISIILLVFAPILVIPFSYSDDTILIRDQMATFLMICAVFMPFCPLGYTSSGYFQGMGWGLKSLSIIVILNLLRIPVCLAMVSVFGTLESIWWGLVIAEILGSLYGGIFGIYSIRKLVRGGYPELISSADMPQC